MRKVLSFEREELSGESERRADFLSAIRRASRYKDLPTNRSVAMKGWCIPASNEVAMTLMDTNAGDTNSSDLRD